MSDAVYRLVVTGHDAGLGYHQRMLADVRRLDAYERAIRALVKPGDVVLDIGTGTGVLAMLAARRGARKVYAVESMSVVEVARDLVAANGLQHIVEVIHDDLTLMSPREPVDLIIGDFLGTFLVDDGMLPAVAVAGGWLKKGGRCSPGRVTLWVAPVGDIGVPVVDVFRQPIYGLDLRAAMRHAVSHPTITATTPQALLGTAQRFHTHAPPNEPPDFEGALRYTLSRDGVLRGLVGWFEAELAPGVILTNAPGTDTHWGQALFPLPPRPVRAGEVLDVHLGLDVDRGELVWTWSVGEGTHTSAPAAPTWRPDPAAARAHGQLAVDAFQRGDLIAAAAAAEAAVAALGPDDDALAPALYENLGLCWFNLGQPRSAATAFLRALDGKPASREQSLRMLVAALEREGRHQESAFLKESCVGWFGTEVG